MFVQVKQLLKYSLFALNLAKKRHPKCYSLFKISPVNTITFSLNVLSGVLRYQSELEINISLKKYESNVRDPEPGTAVILPCSCCFQQLRNNDVYPTKAYYLTVGSA